MSEEKKFPFKTVKKEDVDKLQEAASKAGGVYYDVIKNYPGLDEQCLLENLFTSRLTAECVLSRLGIDPLRRKENEEE